MVCFVPDSPCVHSPQRNRHLWPDCPRLSLCQCGDGGDRVWNVPCIGWVEALESLDSFATLSVMPVHISESTTRVATSGKSSRDSAVEMWRKGGRDAALGRRTTGGGLFSGVDRHVGGCSAVCWPSVLTRASLRYQEGLVESGVSFTVRCCSCGGCAAVSSTYAIADLRFRGMS